MFRQVFLDPRECSIAEKFSGGVRLVQGACCALLWEELAERFHGGPQDHATVLAVAEMPVHSLSGVHIHRFVQKAR